jgi:hypothetical protein
MAQNKSTCFLIFTLILSSCLSSFLEAKSKDSEGPSPEARSWAESLQEKDLLKSVIPLRILILEQNFESKTSKNLTRDDTTKITDALNSIRPLDFNFTLCNQTSFMTCINSADFMYGMRINKIPEKIDEKTVLKFAQANAIIYQDEKQLFLRAPGISAPLKIGASKLLDKELNVRNMFEKMFTALGYDGIVLDIKGDFLLIGTLDSKIKNPETQGLVIKNSAERVVIAEGGAKQGSSLIGLIDQYGGYAVFKVLVFSKSKTVKVGQKVIIGKEN